MPRRLRTAVFFFSLASASTPLPLIAADGRALVGGTVVDQDGRPLPRARVRVLPGLDAATAVAGADGFTDDTGRVKRRF